MSRAIQPWARRTGHDGARACSFFTACVRVVYLPALPTFFLVLPMLLRSLNFFLSPFFTLAFFALRASIASP